MGRSLLSLSPPDLSNSRMVPHRRHRRMLASRLGKEPSKLCLERRLSCLVIRSTPDDSRLSVDRFSISYFIWFLVGILLLSHYTKVATFCTSFILMSVCYLRVTKKEIWSVSKWSNEYFMSHLLTKLSKSWHWREGITSLRSLRKSALHLERKKSVVMENGNRWSTRDGNSVEWVVCM